MQEINLKIKVDGSGNIIIDQASDKIKRLGNDGSEAGKKISASFEVMKGVLESALVEEGFHKVMDFLKESVDGFMEADASAVRLENTMRAMGNGSEFPRLSEEIAEVSKNSTFAESEFTKAAASLVRFTAIPASQYMRALKLAADMAATSGGNLSGEIEKIGKSTLGMGRGLLEYGVKIKDLDSQGDDIVENMTALESRVKGADQAMADSASGGMLMAKKGFVELEETVGKSLSPTLAALTPVLKDVMEGLKDDPEALKAVSIAFTFMAEGMAEAVWVGSDLIAVMAWILSGGGLWSKSIYDSGMAFAKLGDQAEGAILRLDKLRTDLSEPGGSNPNLFSADQWKALGGNIEHATDKAKTAIEVISKEEQEANKLIREILASSQSDATEKKIEELASKAEQAAEKLKEAGKDTQPAWDALGKAMANVYDEADRLRGIDLSGIITGLEKPIEELSLAGVTGMNKIGNDMKKALSDYDQSFMQTMAEKQKSITFNEAEQSKIIEAYEQGKLAIMRKYDGLMLDEQNSTDQKMIKQMQDLTGIAQKELAKFDIEAKMMEVGNLLSWFGQQSQKYQAGHLEEFERLSKQFDSLQDNLNDVDRTWQATDSTVQSVSGSIDQAASSAGSLGDSLVSAAGDGTKAFKSLDEQITDSFNLLKSTMTAAQEIEAVFGADKPHIIGYSGNNAVWNTASGAAPAGGAAAGPARYVIGYSGDTPVYNDGSHASGLDYVPYDGYMAKTHRREAILSPDDADAWRQGKGGGGITVGELHLHAAAGELATQTDQVRFVREVVIPELARATR